MLITSIPFSIKKVIKMQEKNGLREIINTLDRLYGETEIIWKGDGHSASDFRNGKAKFFCGQESYEINGKSFSFDYKIICPVCGGEGRDLKHENWTSDFCLIKCKLCNTIVDCDSIEFADWKVGESNRNKKQEKIGEKNENFSTK